MKNVNYRMALANDTDFINSLTDEGDITLGHEAFGVIAIVEGENGYEPVGAAWAVVKPQGIQAFVEAVSPYNTSEVEGALRNKLSEKALDRGIEKL